MCPIRDWLSTNLGRNLGDRTPQMTLQVLFEHKYDREAEGNAQEPVWSGHFTALWIETQMQTKLVLCNILCACFNPNVCIYKEAKKETFQQLCPIKSSLSVPLHRDLIWTQKEPGPFPTQLQSCNACLETLRSSTNAGSTKCWNRYKRNAQPTHFHKKHKPFLWPRKQPWKQVVCCHGKPLCFHAIYRCRPPQQRHSYCHRCNDRGDSSTCTETPARTLRMEGREQLLTNQGHKLGIQCNDTCNKPVSNKNNIEICTLSTYLCGSYQGCGEKWYWEGPGLPRLYSVCISGAEASAALPSAAPPMSCHSVSTHQQIGWWTATFSAWAPTTAVWGHLVVHKRQHTHTWASPWRTCSSSLSCSWAWRLSWYPSCRRRGAGRSGCTRQCGAPRALGPWQPAEWD